VLYPDFTTPGPASFVVVDWTGDTPFTRRLATGYTGANLPLSNRRGRQVLMS